MAKKKDISKGIRALLSNIDSKSERKEVEKKSRDVATDKVLLSQIEVNLAQPRKEFNDDSIKELAESIKIHGIIQPLTVRKISIDRYQLISGERRFRASKEAGLKEVPVYIRDVNDQELLEMALIENIQREDLNALEVAFALQRLVEECELSHENLAKRVAKKRSTVSNYLRLLKLPPEIQDALKTGQISMGHARVLAGTDDVALQLTFYDKILNTKLSVRQTEALYRTWTQGKSKSKKGNNDVSQLPTELLLIQKEMKGQFGTSVRIERAKSGKGKIVIPFSNDSELNYILDVFKE